MREDNRGTTVNDQAQTCTVCGGTGFKLIEARDERGRSVQKATRCECQLRMRNQRLLEAARIPARYEHCDLGNFEIDRSGHPSPSLANARLKAGRFVEDYPVHQRDGLLFIGGLGVGKTHLAVGIIKELMLEKGVPCLFYDYRELLKQIQNSYNASVSATELEVLRPVFETEVLVLDELGAVKPSEWVWDTVSLVLNTRYNEKRTTIITTNFKDLPAGSAEQSPKGSFSQAARANRDETLGDRIGNRMHSRLHEMCRVVEITGEDYRLTYKNLSNRSR